MAWRDVVNTWSSLFNLRSKTAPTFFNNKPGHLRCVSRPHPSRPCSVLERQAHCALMRARSVSSPLGLVCALRVMTSSALKCSPLLAPDRDELAQLWLKGTKVAAPASVAPTAPPDYLYVLGAIFGGSTVLSGLLSSSPRIATLCASGIHQCEGCMVLGFCHVGPRFSGWTRTAAWPEASLPAPNSWGDALRALKPFWRLERRADPARTVKMNKCALGDADLWGSTPRLADWRANLLVTHAPLAS